MWTSCRAHGRPGNIAKGHNQSPVFLHTAQLRDSDEWLAEIVGFTTHTAQLRDSDEWMAEIVGFTTHTAQLGDSDEWLVELSLIHI